MPHSRTCTLLLPGFERGLGSDTAWPPLPALQTLLSKGKRTPSSPDYLASLFAHFAMPTEGEGDRPVAALCALAAELDAEQGWWLRVDPVHLEAGRDQVYLSAYRELQLDPLEADELVAELNRVYAEDGWQFFAPTPQQWLLRLPQPWAMTTTPTERAEGRSVAETLPQGADAMAWQRVMNEVQMLLHTSHVNERREVRGEQAVNGLWFWGGGSLPEAGKEGAWTQIIADDCLTRGLARLHHVTTEASSATVLATVAQKGGKLLWVESSLQRLQPSVEVLAQLERQCFAPLLALLRSGDLSQLVIELPGLGRWRVDRSALRRWWRRTRPVGQLLKDC